MQLAMMHGWMLTAWWLIAVTVVIGIAIVVVVAVQRFGGAATRRALEVLDERYARGEIDEDEYRRRRRLLEQPR